MGLYFRKSESFGPFKLNFSKSGVGVSTGVKGARLSMGPNGTYINVGRNGIYYRKKVKGATSKEVVATNKPISSTLSNYENFYSFTDAIRVSPASGNTSELGDDIIKNIKRARVFTWLLVILSIMLIPVTYGWILLPAVIVRLAFSKLFHAVTRYDLDNSASLEWDKFSEIIKLLKTSKRLWIIETAKLNSNTKYNAGASRSISRGVVTVRKIKPNRKTGFKIKANVPTVVLKSNKCSLLFLPSDVLIKKGRKFVAYSYEQLSVYSSTTIFIENGAVSRDAEIIRYTWQYVNKNGTADKRFNHNRQLPVCRYGLVHFTVGGETSIELHTSNKLVAQNAGKAYHCYKSFIDTIGLAPDVVAKVPRESSTRVLNQLLEVFQIGESQKKTNLSETTIMTAGAAVPEYSNAIANSDISEGMLNAGDTENGNETDTALIDDMLMFLEEEQK